MHTLDDKPTMITPKRIWLTYSWTDNKHDDVDFIASQLVAKGLEIHLDRWDLKAGHSIWQQIGKAINDPTQCDGWAIFATANSLSNKKCLEELDYAINRALECRGGEFPLIAISPGPVTPNILPTALKVRLAVSLTDAEWADRVVSGVLNQQPEITRREPPPYVLVVHKVPNERKMIEMRPRAGQWAPFHCAIPDAERTVVEPSLYVGPAGVVPSNSVLIDYSRGRGGEHDEWWVMKSSQAATPLTSYYLRCLTLPSQVVFGAYGGTPAFNVQLSSMR